MRKANVYRKKPPQGFEDLIAKAQELRLYVIQSFGPTSFIQASEDGQKFKISIGETIMCSCKYTFYGHCQHTLHAMLKKFRVNPTNSILWQDGYSDSEINDILSGKYSNTNTKIPENKKKEAPHVQKQQIERHQISDDENCPICYENIKKNEPLTFCKRQCGTNFHAKCAKIWAEQQQFQGKMQITCPICRADWGSNAVNEIKKDEREYNEKCRIHKAMCRECKISPIMGNIYQCVYCSKVVLCSKCYIHLYHSEHHSFLVRTRNDENWQPISRKGDSRDEIEFYYDCFPSADTENPTGKLLIVGSNLKKEKVRCDFCQEIDPLWKQLIFRRNYKFYSLPTQIQIRQLKCGHKFDRKCLIKLLEQKFICPFDGVSSLEGLVQTLSKEEKQKVQIRRASSQQQQQQQESQKKIIEIGRLQKPPKAPPVKKQGEQPQLQVGGTIEKPKQILPTLSFSNERFNENSYQKKRIKKGFVIRSKKLPQKETMDNLIQVQQIRQKLDVRSEQNMSHYDEIHTNQDSEIEYF